MKLDELAAKPDTHMQAYKHQALALSRQFDPDLLRASYATVLCSS